MSIAERGGTLRAVLMQLLQQGLLDEQSLLRIEEYFGKQKTATSEPWFVKLLMALGAWVAAICFVACLGIAGLVGQQGISWISWGAVFLVAATSMRRVFKHVFPVQLALALSVVGHGFVLAGAAELAGGDEAFAAVALAAVVLGGVLYLIYPDSLHRFLSCLLAAACLTTWLVHARLWPLIHLEMLAKLVVLGFVFISRPDSRLLRPLGYALAVSVPGTLFLVLLPKDVLDAPWWPASVILAMALVWLYQWAAGGWKQLKSEPLLLAVITTVCLAAVTTPGVLAAVGLMVLGYARNDRYLLSLGILFFPIFIVVFYYDWQISLLVKSWIMMGSGAVLLIARWLLELRGWTRELI